MNSDPWNRLRIFPVLDDFLNLRLVVEHGTVTPDTPLHRWDSSHWPSPRVRVTELAVNLHLGDVILMTEGDRLCGRFGW